MMDICQKVSLLYQARDDVEEQTRVTMNDLKKAKQEVNVKFDNMIKEAEKNMKDAINNI